MSGSESRTHQDPESEGGGLTLEDAIRELLRHHRYLHEFRIQKLLYIADLVAKLKSDNEERLTDADFKPYMYGSYSEDIRNTLNNLQSDLPNEPDYQYGKVTTKFLGKDHPRFPPDLDLFDSETIDREDAIDIIEAVSEATDGVPNEELGDWSKDTWLYQSTEYDSEMDFDRIDAVRERVKEQLLDAFPELKDVLEENPSS